MTGSWLHTIRARWKVRRRFRAESQLLAGREVGDPDRPSAVLFTVERAASRFVTRMLAPLARDAGLVPIDLDSYHYELNRIAEWIGGGRGGDDRLFERPGCFFGPLRTASANVLGLSHRSVLVLRDPRDVLVSLHRNHGWEPRLPLLGDDVAARRIEREMDHARTVGIDDFVLSMARPESHVRRTLEAYRRHLVGRPHVLFLTYEEMVADFSAWLHRIVEHFGWRPEPRLLDRVLRVAGEGASGRATRVGDHRRALRPETVEALDGELGPLLAALGYAP